MSLVRAAVRIVLVCASVFFTTTAVRARAADTSSPPALLRAAVAGAADTGGAPVGPAATALGVLRARTVELDAELLADLLATPAQTVRMPLFDDLDLNVVFERQQTLEPGRCAWFGRIQGLEPSSVTLVLCEGVVAASVVAGPNGYFDLRPRPDGSYLVRQLDRAVMATCGMTPGGLWADSTAGMPSLTGARSVRRPGRTSSASLTTAADSEVGRYDAAPPGADGSQPISAGRVAYVDGCDDGTVIDLLAVYTPDARQAAGGTAAMHALIDLAIADANAAYDRSLIDTSIRLVHRQEVPYDESGAAGTDVARLIDPDDGHLDDVPPLRDQYGADCVSLWVNSLDYGGVGFYPDSSLLGVGLSGITEMRQDNAALLIIAHEVGHNLWCAHDRDNAVGVPYADYSYGYREPGAAWHTIMAYPPGETIPYFANPNVNWPGPDPPNPGPTGIPDGQPNPCDIALTIEQTKHIVANFRATAVPGLPSVLYVRADAPGGGTGTSWATAIQDLHDALCTAAGSNGAVQQIWVKEGTYRPDRGTGDRKATFRLQDGLAVYGGFAGNETSLDQRDPVAHVTVLSGDIGTPGVTSDNSHHVVTATLNDPTAVLDGFTVRDGNADGASPDDQGGGVLIDSGGSPTLVNCVIRSNSALYGAGLYAGYDSDPALTGCTFTENTAPGTSWPQGGGGVYLYAGCSPTLTDCTFTDNTALLGSGLAALFDCSPVLTGCVFEQNVGPAGAAGGGVYAYANIDAVLTDCEFRDNSAVDGAGMYEAFGCDSTFTGCVFEGNTGPAGNIGAGLENYSECSPVLNDCLFLGNTALHGAAIASSWGSTPKATNCVFLGNAVTGDGGAVNNYQSTPIELTNCLFVANAAGTGGAVFNYAECDSVLTNCTLVENSAAWAGGGLYSYQSDPALANTILWNNRVGGSNTETTQIFSDTSTPALNYCTVRGWTGSLGGIGNNGSNPQFVDANGTDNIYGTTDDNARPQLGSPAIDTGSNAAIPPGVTTDLDGRDRIHNGTVDRGAYELFFGDYDRDGDVDVADHAVFYDCMDGPGAAPTPTLPGVTAQSCRDAFDFDGDTDVDLGDYRDFGLSVGPGA